MRRWIGAASHRMCAPPRLLSSAACRKPPKPEPGRVTRAFAEFGGSDWVSKTVLKHTLAAIIQVIRHTTDCA